MNDNSFDSPFGGMMGLGGPFGGMPGLGTPFGGSMGGPSNDDTEPGGLNVDDLVKKIDAKLAELEEEDKQNQEDTENSNDSKKIIEGELDNENTGLYDGGTYSDDFFNDFFSDD